MQPLRGFPNIVKVWKNISLPKPRTQNSEKGEKEREYVDRLREREGVREVGEEGGRHH